MVGRTAVPVTVTSAGVVYFAGPCQHQLPGFDLLNSPTSDEAKHRVGFRLLFCGTLPVFDDDHFIFVTTRRF